MAIDVCTLFHVSITMLPLSSDETLTWEKKQCLWNTIICVIWFFFPLTDENNTGSDSDFDEDAAEASCSKAEHTPSLKNEETLWKRAAVSKSKDDQDTAKDRLVSRASEDTFSKEMNSSKKQIKGGVVPVMLQTQGLSSLSSAHLQTLDFSSAHSQQFLKFGAPLLFQPGQLSGKPEAFPSMGMEPLFSSLSGPNELDAGGLSPQSITSSSPLMLHLSQHMLASQVRLYRGTVLQYNLS